jgi:hypothetical protein
MGSFLVKYILHNNYLFIKGKTMKYRYLIISAIVSIAILNTGCVKEPTTIETTKPVVQTTDKTNQKPLPTQSTSKSGQPAPKIVFEKTVLDFGKISPGEPALGQFNFKNEGPGELQISKVSECCGITATYDQEKKYKSGESGVIKIEFKNSSINGEFVRNPIVHSNDPNTPEFSLTVKAVIEEMVTLQPERLALFSSEDNAACPKLTIKSNDNKPFSIMGYKSTGGCITIEFDKSIKKAEFILEPKVDIEKLKTNPTGYLTLEISHPQGNVAVRMDYNEMPEYSHQSLFNKFLAEPLKPQTQTITVKNNLGRDFEIESVTSQEKTIKLISKTKKETGNVKSYVLELEVTPPALTKEDLASTGQISCIDKLFIKIKDGPTLTTTCNIYYKDSSTKTETK